MTDFIEGESRTQTTLFPDSLDDYVEVHTQSTAPNKRKN